MIEARWWHESDGYAICRLCPHGCRIAEGKAGICGSRVNRKGKLYSAVYGYPCALAIDPVEKKPLYHFLPGTTCFSFSCVGCNLRCKGCQNWSISQAAPGGEKEYWAPEELVDLAIKKGCPSIAYTYTEPLTWYEYCFDTACLAHEKGLYNILVSAAYINPEPLREIAPLIDAANIDLKYFSDELYRKVSGAGLKPVLDALLLLRDAGVHLEITNLLIPGINDDEAMIRAMCKWLSSNGLSNVPLHFSRFFPNHKLDSTPPTPLKTLHLARSIAREQGLTIIHLGNV
jgi:pyruvate formate lyase activating enzyme